MNNVRASLRDVILDAIQVLEFRDIFYFDPFAKQWRGSLKQDDVIQTTFGQVLFQYLQPHDGVIVCSHSDGTAYLQGPWIANANENEEYYRVLDRIAPPPKAKSEEFVQEDECEIEPHQNKTQTIDLRGCFLQPTDIPLLSNPLKTNASYFVQFLNLSGNQLDDSSIELLSSALSKNGALKHLVLSYNAISATGSSALANSMLTNIALEHLDLTHNHIGSKGLLEWLSLKANKTLTALHMSHNPEIADEGGVDILRPLAQEPLSLHEETRRQLLLKSKTYTASLHDAPANTTIRTLALSEIGLSLASAQRLEHVLASTKVLTSLDVSMNSFSAPCNLAIATGIAANTSLLYLHYGANVLDDPAAQAMAKALENHPTLQTALFPSCFHGSQAAAWLAQTISANSRLTHFDVSSGKLEHPGILTLCKAIGTNKSLQVLEMTSTGLKSDNAIQVLATALEANNTLRELHLGYNNITLRGCKLLREAIEKKGKCQLSAETLYLEGNSGAKSRNSSVLITGGCLSPTKREDKENTEFKVDSV